jgi:hypothetical protein
MEASTAQASNHYDLTEWVDYARGMTDLERFRQMDEHLAQGCAHCQDLANFCECVKRFYGTMLATTVPDRIMSRANAIFALQRDDSRKVSFLVPKLIIENVAALSAAGIRTGGSTAWQALYQAGEYALDVRVDPDPTIARAATMVGQVLNHALPKSFDGMHVALKAGKCVVAESRCNEFGEFQLNYIQRRNLQLFVHLEQQSTCLRISVKAFASGLWSQRDGSHGRRAPKV